MWREGLLKETAGRVLAGVIVLALPPGAAVATSPACQRVEFNHGSTAWSLERPCPRSRVLLVPAPVESRLLVPAMTKVEIWVVNTNPLLYAAIDTIEERQATGVEELREWAALIGRLLGRVAQLDALAPDEQVRIGKVLPELSKIVPRLQDLLLLLQQLWEQKARALACIQEVEDGLPGGLDEIGTCTCDPDGFDIDPAKVQKAFATWFEALSGAIRVAPEAAGSQADPKTTGSPPKPWPEEAGEFVAELASLAKVEEGALRAAGRLQQFKQRLQGATVGRQVVRTSFRVPYPDAPVRWDRELVHKIVVQPDSPYGASIERARPAKVETILVVARNTSRLLGVGIGLTHTPLTSPSWTLSPDPSDPSQQVITRSDEESRSGELALFLNYRLGSALRAKARGRGIQPGIEVGVGLDTDKPAGFVGGSLEIGRFIRLGAGLTWQEVKILRGLGEGASLPAGSSIPQGNDFERAGYVSLTFAVDSLKFFRGE